MIKIENLSKSYNTNGNNLLALNNIDLDIDKGDIYGIIGLSGAGKSTLIRCINRLEEPDSGKIFIEGENIVDLSRKELNLRRKDIGMIFQNFNLLNQKTVYENIALPLRLQKLNHSEIDERVLSLLDYVELADKKDAYPGQLSGGQKQRVSIARALANDPKILLSDEATSALDPKTTKSILDLLKKIRDEFGLTIVLITHQMEVVKEVCNKVAIIEDGEIIETNTPIELFKNPKTKIAKSFIRNLNKEDEEEYIDPKSFRGKIIRLGFLGHSAKKPIVSRMIKSYDIEANILSGNINDLVNTSVGYLILELLGDANEVNDAINYLKSQNVDVEVI